MERAERMVLLGVGLAFDILVPVLWIMLVLTAVTAVHRFVMVWRQATPAPSARPPAGRMRTRFVRSHRARRTRPSPRISRTGPALTSRAALPPRARLPHRATWLSRAHGRSLLAGRRRQVARNLRRATDGALERRRAATRATRQRLRELRRATGTSCSGFGRDVRRRCEADTSTPRATSTSQAAGRRAAA